MIRTLLVEDDVGVASLYSAWLAEHPDFEMLGCAENLDIARAMTTTLLPDLLLLDIGLPDGRGLELLRELRLGGQSTDVILITVADDIGSVNQAATYGAADYLLKPVSPERFRQSLERVAARLRLWANERANQEDIDALFAQPPPLGEGLEPATLGRVRRALAHGESVSAAQLGERVGLSRVSAWRYLEYLLQKGEVTVCPSPRSVGRPVKLYCKRQLRGI